MALHSLLTIAALVAPALAQTSTLCDPLKLVCPVDEALGTTYNTTWDSESTISDKYWTVDSNGPTFPSDNSGAAFTVSAKGTAPLVQSTFYMFWSHFSVLMKAAPGQGIISSIVLLSDDLDEIDWEIMGSNTTHVETNYYGKGNVSQINSEYFPCDSPQDSFHNYTVNWNAKQVEWILDGKTVRTVTYDEAVDDDGKTMFPQTPMQLKIGSWAGGDPDNPEGTIEWAGGVTDYSKGPYSMSVKSVLAIDGTTNATHYKYGDFTGDWQSIEVTKGISKASAAIHAPPPLTASERWAKIPHGAQIAIVASGISVGVILTLLYAFCCIKQRRAGKRERIAADAAWEKEMEELARWKQMAHEKHFQGKKGGIRVGVVPVG